MVVDDDPHTRFLVSACLADHTAAITEFGSAPPALDALHTSHFDLLITDLQMPGTHDGHWLLIEARRHFADLPIIVITGSQPENDELSAADAVVFKPFHPDELLGEVLHLLGD